MDQNKPEAPKPDTAPAKDLAKTAPTQLVKVKAVRPIRDAKNDIVNPGGIAEVTQEQAKELCDHPFKGSYAFFGERVEEEVERHQIRRAVRVA